MFELTRSQLVMGHIDTTAIVEPGVLPLWGDRVQLQQVLLNLIFNGCEAMSTTPSQGRRLVVKAERDGPDHVHLVVSDSGSGIPAELMGSVVRAVRDDEARWPRTRVVHLQNHHRGARRPALGREQILIAGPRCTACCRR